MAPPPLAGLAALALPACLLLGRAHGHGAVTQPRPRQAIDGFLAPWNGSVPKYPVPFTNPNWCEVPGAGSTDPRGYTGKNGQACFWFNNGCDIGSDKCDGVTGQTGPQCCNKKFLYTGNSTVPSWGGEGIVPDPSFLSKFDRTKVRPKFATFTDRKPTICDKSLRTINTNAECGAPDDFWYYHPWRYPGMSPVTDSCGTAGGVLPGQGKASGGAEYTNTINAKLGDLGAGLPPLPTGTKWEAGSDVEVAWGLKAWHGGGYTYRLAPADAPLTEEAFNKLSLKFVGNSSLRWGGVGGKELPFDSAAKGWQVSEGTVPEGSMWRKIPIPRTVNEWYMYGASFEPVCEEPPECRNSHTKTPAPGVCKCSGDWNDLVEIVDRVHIPADLKPGNYVLGWRWDCEESTQVWTSCSDVTVCTPGVPCHPPAAYTPQPPPPPTPPGVYRPNTNFWGDDIEQFALNASATKDDCEAKCKATTGCAAFTFGPASCCGGCGGQAKCWTKSSADPQDVRDGGNCYGSEVIKQ